MHPKYVKTDLIKFWNTYNALSLSEYYRELYPMITDFL